MPLMLPLAAAPMAELRQCVRAAPPARLVERSLHLLGVPIVKLEPAGMDQVGAASVIEV